MKTGVNIKFVKSNTKVKFEELTDVQFFFSNDTLYKKIATNDLKFFGIDNVNAISIIFGQLTKFHADEIVYLVE